MAAMRKLILIFSLLLLASCKQELTVAQLEAKLAAAKVANEAVQTEVSLGSMLTYRIVCLNGIQYYASRVTSYAGQFAVEHYSWVIGGAVVNPAGGSMYAMKCEGK
jgi:hypothetical protein